jgi:hypothetical protein
MLSFLHDEDLGETEPVKKLCMHRQVRHQATMQEANRVKSASQSFPTG